MHEPYAPDEPLYGTICQGGKEWTITLKEKSTSTGATISGTISGYGSFPYEKYSYIPVIDFTGESFDRCFEGLKILDGGKSQLVKTGKYSVDDLMWDYRKKGFTICRGFGGI